MISLAGKQVKSTFNRTNTFKLSLLLWSSVALLLIKLLSAINYTSDTRIIFVASYIQDLFIMVLIFIGFSLLDSAAKSENRWVNFFYSLMLMLFFVSCRIYSRHAPDLMDFQVNLFGVNTATASFFVEYFLDPIFFLEIIMTIGVLVAASFFLKVCFSNRVRNIGLAIITLAFLISLSGPHVNPILYALLDEADGRLNSHSGLERLDKLCVVETNRKADFPDLVRTMNIGSDLSPLYKRVIVLVMESVNYQDFIKASNDGLDFISSQGSHTLCYDNYFSTNLDSYTGLLVMLNAVMIPYQAYLDPRKFDFINHRPNLVRHFNAIGYKTLFLTSYGEQQRRFIPNPKEWNDVKCLQEFPEKYTSVTSVKIERACEDLAVLPELLKSVRNNDRIFLMQEMVYGHTREWKAKKGSVTIPYYNHFFNVLLDSLNRCKLLDSTLLVITSDHGPRQIQTNVDNYHIPLLFWAKNLNRQRDSSFLSHIDFADILRAQLYGIPLNSSRRRIYTIGNSGNLYYGEIKKGGSFTFIEERLKRVYTNELKHSPQSFQRSFAQYRIAFDALKGIP